MGVFLSSLILNFRSLGGYLSQNLHMVQAPTLGLEHLASFKNKPTANVYLILTLQTRFSGFLVDFVELMPGATDVNDLNLRLATHQIFQDGIMDENKLGLRK